MATLESIPLELTEIPVRKTIVLESVELELEFDYNSVGDFYTMLVRSVENDEIIYSTKLVYGIEANHFAVEGFPYNITILPVAIEDIVSDESVDIEFNQANFARIKIAIGRIEE
jgi:hypothetical protein